MQQTNAIVSQRIDVAPELLILRVAPDGWEFPTFTPGQWTVIGLPGDAPRCQGAGPEPRPPRTDRLLKRAYSIASPPNSPECLEFYVALIAGGQLTPRLFALQPGDRIWLSARASGRFALTEAPEDAHVVFIATGTGLAPCMSMLRGDARPRSTRKFAVLHGVRHVRDLGYRAELEALARADDSVHYLPIISRPSEDSAGWDGPTGHVQVLWSGGAVREAWGLAPEPGNTHVFLCGSPAMIEDMVGLLAQDGFEEQTHDRAGQIHVERYW